MIESSLCPLCGVLEKSGDHLFFLCDYSETVWVKVLTWQGFSRRSMGLKEEVTCAVANVNGKSAIAKWFRMALVGCAYLIWQERSLGVFQAI